MFSWPPCWAGSWAHSLLGTPTTPGHQHLTGPAPLPAQTPPLLLSSLGQALYYPPLVAFHRAAVIRSDSRILSSPGFQRFSEQRKELCGYHLILLIGSECSKKTLSGTIFTWKMSLKDFQAVVC